MSTPLLEVQALVRDYSLPRTRLFGPAPRLRALDGVSLTLAAGRSFGIVGESGCGKSTLARSIVALERPDGGAVRLHGQDLFALTPQALRGKRRSLQMVFQDPYGSLDPRMAVGRIVAEPIAGLEPATPQSTRRARVAETLIAVGLREGDARRYPHEFSGGQRQRIAIARALITSPELVVADEPVSALDVSVQAQVLNLLLDLQQARGLALLFISHDLSVVRYVTEEVAVMYHGRIVEQGPTAAVLSHPRHPYTRALIEAVPRLAAKTAGRGRAAPAALVEPPSDPALARGCRYAARCPFAGEDCRQKDPTLEPSGAGHRVACHFPL